MALILFKFCLFYYFVWISVCLQVCMWVLEINPRSSTKAGSALNHWANLLTSPQQYFCSFFIYGCCLFYTLYTVILLHLTIISRRCFLKIVYMAQEIKTLLKDSFLLSHFYQVIALGNNNTDLNSRECLPCLRSWE